MTGGNADRVIALGASNLTRLLPTLMRTRHKATEARATASHWFVANGLGRSYGIRSRVFWRDLPGIDGCGIWQALESAEPCADATGIVTDVGNDIFYGVEVERILGWVENALSRLRPMCSRLVVTGIPETVTQLGGFRFGIMRRVIVPSCKLDLVEGKRRAAQLHDGLRELAERFDARFQTGERRWYGWDAIHVKWRHWRAFAADLLGVLAEGRLPRLRGRRGVARPELRWMFGREQRTGQPALRWADGTTLSLF